jgi:hypothetical protein
MDVPKPQARPSLLFRYLQAAYVGAVVWCLPILLVAHHVRDPMRSSRPGSEFAIGVIPTAMFVACALFWAGAAWTAVSHEARQSKLVKWSVCVAFGAWVFSILLDLQLL